MRVGFVGWRGMVGSVLMDRMTAEGDFTGPGLEPVFFSTSQPGGPAPRPEAPPLRDARDLDALGAMDAIVSCQGGPYTLEVHPRLRSRGWAGYWVDAASALRMRDDAVIVLDPVNGPAIERAIAAGVRDFVGGNCTVSLLLMGLAGLFDTTRHERWVEWVSTMTYQAASGAGAAALRELVEQMHAVGLATADLLASSADASALELDRRVTAALRGPAMPIATFGAPLAASLIPWIDSPVEGGQTREEWKGMAEANKILETDAPIPVDGLCVRVGAMRCHSQAVTIKLTRAVPLDELEAAIATAHPWAEVVPNTKEATLARLSPAAVSGTLAVPVGRLHTLRMGPEYLAAFTVGDQLLWGAAEPLRRVLKMIR